MSEDRGKIEGRAKRKGEKEGRGTNINILNL